MKTLALDIRSTFFGSNSGANNLASDPGTLISNLVPNIIIAAGLVFLILIIYSGFNIVSGAGGDPKTMAKSKQAITYGLIGFLIVVSAYFILQFVSTTLTGDDFILTNPTL